MLSFDKFLLDRLPHYCLQKTIVQNAQYLAKKSVVNDTTII